MSRAEPRLRRAARAKLPESLRAKLDPADVVQETFASCLSRWDGGDGVPSSEREVFRYLLACVRNRVIDCVRRFRNELKRQLHLDDARAGVHLAWDAKEFSPEDAADFRERVTRLIERASPAHRQLLLLHFEGCSMPDLVRITRFHEASIRRIIREAMAELTADEEPTDAPTDPTVSCSLP